eukprot:gnl/TRDRNA2_/TRDRNA2_86152_c0_seq2.p1 gnl/TRDRNA2_/TRDRNA2_86152_c0~~gnl/TRDRNA2_/TRDRNA2_86152_c0_seq2.p1  ORF type:complete len:301 (-),score=85.11 gnl/TRDRNA2_/TRDRNA2_86152_c0_seq2:130-906(-)
MFISLRVGEMQKLSKMSACTNNKSYKFPPNAVKDHRYGKLEIYRRIGGSNIGIDPKKNGVYEVAVPVDDSKFDKGMRFRVDVGTENRAPAKLEPPPVESNPKVLEAKDYLEQHQLELRLSEAMQAVLRERPEDPGVFIAKMLMSNVGMLKEVAKPKLAAPEAPLKFNRLPSAANNMMMKPKPLMSADKMQAASPATASPAKSEKPAWRLPSMANNMLMLPCKKEKEKETVRNGVMIRQAAMVGPVFYSLAPTCILKTP